MEIAAWIERVFPGIEPNPWGEACWLSFIKTRVPEHNPPIYWLGRAMDAVADGGATDSVAARLRHAHPDEPCEGWSENDQRVQDILSEACAFAWAAAHLGPPQFAPTGESASAPLLVHVPVHDAYVAPRRLWPARRMEDLLQSIAQHGEEAAALLPPATGRILYVDLYLQPMYAQGVGYHNELTEPLRAAIKHFAGEQRLGYVLTRPFQWGNAIEAHY